MTCPKCGGAGSYMYDENHGKPCEVCCRHDMGFARLDDEGYGENAGRWCCRAGCGYLLPDGTEPTP